MLHLSVRYDTVDGCSVQSSLRFLRESLVLLFCLFMYRKNKDSENPVPEFEPTPLGFWREALTNKKHSRTRSVRLMFPAELR